MTGERARKAKEKFQEIKDHMVAFYMNSGLETDLDKAIALIFDAFKEEFDLIDESLDFTIGKSWE